MSAISLKNEHALRKAVSPDFPIHQQTNISHFEAHLDQLLENFQLELRLNLMLTPNLPAYLLLLQKEFTQFQEADYLSPRHTYHALSAAGLRSADVHYFLHEYPQLFTIDESRPLHPELRPAHSPYPPDARTEGIRFVHQTLFPILRTLLYDHLEAAGADRSFSARAIFAPSMFCSSYQWLTILKARTFIHEAIEVQNTPPLHLVQMPQPVYKAARSGTHPAPLQSFGYRLSDTRPLEQLCTELMRRLDFLQQSKNSIADFLEVLTTPNLPATRARIHFACETTQAAYILAGIKPHFDRLTFQNIERSDKFFTHSGSPLKAGNLSKSSSVQPKQKDFIDHTLNTIFKKIQ